MLIFVAIGDFVQEHSGVRQQVIASSGTSLKLMLLLLHPNLLLLRLLLGQPRGQLGRCGHGRGGGSPKHAETTAGSRCRRRCSSSSSSCTSCITQPISLKFAVPGLVEELGELTIHCSRTHARTHTPSRAHTHTHTSTSPLVERGSRFGKVTHTLALADFG